MNSQVIATAIIALFAGGSALADSKPTAPVTVTLADVVQKVSTENYTVYSNALRVYQAREAIQVARGNLLPKLNVWRLAGVAVEMVLGNYASAIGLVQDVAPFLVPTNWFRLKEQKLLYLADQEGYRALWANELMTAKALYTHLLLDQSLLAHIEDSRKDLEELLLIVQTRETFGGAPQGAARDVEVRLLALQEDKRALESLIAEEESLLAFMMGLSTSVSVIPAPIPMPDFGALKPLDYTDFEYRAVDSSPEVRQFGHFIVAADRVKQEAAYSFLGSANQSRGTGGGVFDGLPMQDGLGFGTPASMRIVRAQKAVLTVQKKALEETIKRHLKLLVTNYNLDLENYANLKRRVELTRATNEQLRERLEMGQDIDILSLIEASRNHIQADTAFFAVQFRFVSNEDKLARLIFHGDYTKKPVVIENLTERK